MAWVVYVLSSRRIGRTYVGIALDVTARLAQHNGRAPGGARATRAGRPWRVRRTYGPFETRAEAQRVEHAVKRLRGRKRLAWGGGEARPTAPAGGPSLAPTHPGDAETAG